MALHRHITYPLANLVLLLLGLPFAIHFERGSRIERVLGAIGMCAAYLLFDLICQNLGYNDWIHPVVAAWSPTILFGSLGVALFSGVKS
jgi:lipopolysaccharide export system permease protein